MSVQCSKPPVSLLRLLFTSIKGGSDPSQGTLLLKQTLVDPITDYSFTPTKLNGSFLFKPGDWFWIVYQYDPMFGFTQGAEYGAPDSLANDFFVSSDKGKNWVTSQQHTGSNKILHVRTEQ